MKLLYASVIELHAGWGAEWFMNQAFNRLGHYTYCVDYRKYRDQLGWKFFRAPLCDAFFLQRGDYFPVQIVHTMNIPKFLWVSELISRCNDQNHLLEHGNFDHVFFRTQECIDTVISRGWLTRDRCSIMLGAFDEDFYRKKNIEKNIDVLFIGTLTPRRRSILHQLSNCLSDSHNQRFNISVVHAYGQDMVNWINRAKIVINIHSDKYKDTETRIFEVLGCGSFLLTESLSTENPFNNHQICSFSSIREAKESIVYYLTHPEERELIAAEGHKEAMIHHKYFNRVVQLIDIFKQYNGIKELNSYNRIGQLRYFIHNEAKYMMKYQLQKISQLR